MKNIKKLTIIVLFVISISCQIQEKGNLLNFQSRKVIDTQSFEQFENSAQSGEVFDMHNFDIVQYNQNGDWALIYYNQIQQFVELIFYNIEGQTIASYKFGDSNLNFHEGELGVSITSTNNQDEVFVAITYEIYTLNIEIVGGIIGVDGKFKRSDSWITILSDEDFNFSKPQIQLCQNYIYVVAYRNNDDHYVFQGDQTDDFYHNKNRNLYGSEEEDDVEEEELGYIVFNFVDISGDLQLQRPQNLQGTVIEFYDTEQTQRVYVNYGIALNIKSVGGSKAVVIFEDTFDNLQGLGDSASLVLVVIDNEIPQLPIIIDNSIESYPNEKKFLRSYNYISVDVIPNTENVCISYNYLKADTNDVYYYITTINTSNNQTICHKSYAFTENSYLQTYIESVNKPTILIESSQLGYISLGTQQGFIGQFNPNTCIIDESIESIPIASNIDNLGTNQKILFLENKSQNKYKIIHTSTEIFKNYIITTMIDLESNMNCNQFDQINQICTQCQSGYGLTEDNQCIKPNCAMNCQIFDQFCNLETYQCYECQFSSQCENNANGSICVNNMCQNTCAFSEDCAYLGQVCNVQTQICEEVVISEQTQKVEIKNSEEISVVEANNKETGQLELEFDIQDETDVEKVDKYEFLKLKIEEENILPLKVQILKNNIRVTLPNQTQKGNQQFRMYANKYIIINNDNNRRNLNSYQKQQIYVEKTVNIVDTIESYIKSQEQIIETQKQEIIQFETNGGIETGDITGDGTNDGTGEGTGDGTGDGVNQSKQQKGSDYIINDLDNEDDDNNIIIYYVLLPVMFIGFIGFTCLGFFLGKKSILNSQKRKVFSKVIEIQQTTETLQTERDE